METRAHTLPQGIWLRSRDQLKEILLSFVIMLIMPRKSRENSVEEKRRMRNENEPKETVVKDR